MTLTPEQLRRALQHAAERVDVDGDAQSELDRARAAHQRTNRRAPFIVLIAAAVAIGGVLVVVGGRRPSPATTVVQRPASTTTAPPSTSTTSAAELRAEELRILAAMDRQYHLGRPQVRMYDRKTHVWVDVPRVDFVALAEQMARDGDYLDEQGNLTHLLAVDDGKLGLGLVLRCSDKGGQRVCEGGGG